MKLKEYLKHLNDFAKKHPEALELNALNCSDDGNSFYIAYCYPSIGVYDDGDFFNFYEIEVNGYKKSDINAVCIN